MFKRIFFAAALAVPMIWAAPAAAQTATDYAANLQSKVGQPLGDSGLMLTSITAEGNTLVIVVDGPAGWRGAMKPQEISDALISGFCQGGNTFFKGGMTMRVDSEDNKASHLKGPLVTKCPA